MQTGWTKTIRARSHWFSVDLRGLWRYKDLIWLFVKRDITAVYKQTILGPFWFIVQPLLQTIVYSFVFARIIGISTDGLPPILFYLSGITLWNYFSSCVTSTSNTFVSNSGIFGKVYFPRLAIPVSAILSCLFRFGIQFIFFLAVWIYFLLADENNSIAPGITIFLLPLLLCIIATLGLGLGLIVSSLTTKYRDFQFLLSFGMQLMMYASAVVFPISLLKDTYKSDTLLRIVKLNPMTSVIETFKYAFTGKGVFDPGNLLYSSAVAVAVLLVGIIMFSRTEKHFMDIV